MLRPLNAEYQNINCGWQQWWQSSLCITQGTRDGDTSSLAASQHFTQCIMQENRDIFHGPLPRHYQQFGKLTWEPSKIISSSIWSFSCPSTQIFVCEEGELHGYKCFADNQIMTSQNKGIHWRNIKCAGPRIVGKYPNVSPAQWPNNKTLPQQNSSQDE